MKTLLAIVAFSVSALLSTGYSELKTADKVVVTAFRATKTSGVGASDTYFNTSACRTLFLSTHPNYVANGKASVEDVLVFVCI